MKELLFEFLHIYLIGVIISLICLMLFILFIVIVHIKRYANIYRKHAKKKNWKTEGINFVRMNTLNEINLKWTFFLLPLMSFGMFFYIAGIIWKDYN